ncbi:hypothetical protein BDV12DRAFT_195057 [Aspergillus spectabilis]
MTASKPLVVIASPSETGHTNHLLPFATHLTKQGYEVHSENAILRADAAFYPVHRVWTDEQMAEIMAIPDQRFIWSLKVVFVDLTPYAMKGFGTYSRNYATNIPPAKS